MSNLGDRIEHLCGHPAAFPLFTAAFLVGLMVSVDVTNIAISYFTAGLLLLTIEGQRRSSKAMHVKLDDPGMRHRRGEQRQRSA